MKTSWILLLALLGMSFSIHGDAAVVTLGGPGISLTYRQPVQAIVVAPSGATLQQTVYYDPAIGGVDLDTSWAGQNASVYFPAFETGYVWYNGYWVDHAGYYWNGTARVHLGHPQWGVYWNNHWHNGWHGGWHGDWHAGWHNGWHGDWHGGWHNGWHGDVHSHWHHR